VYRMSWLELAKRHKGKIIAGGVIIGGAVAVTMGMNQKRVESPHEENGLQARRHYVFDANQSACDESIRELAPSIFRMVQARFNVEALTRQLQEGNLSTEKKIELWNELKMTVIGRLVCVSHALSLLTLTLKAQISILAADIVTITSGGNKTNGWWSWAPTSMTAFIGGKGEMSVEDRRRNDTARQVFLRSIEFFTQIGVLELAQVVEEVVKRELKDVRLDETRDSEELLAFLNSLSVKVAHEAAPLSAYVAPIDKDDTSRDSVTLLLRRLISLLDGEQCRETNGRLVQFYLSASTTSIVSGPLANQLSSLSSSFSSLSRLGLDSPLENSLCSSDVHRFAIHAFNAPSSF
ncbi:hypothetical protein PENTCL1PPCAC_26957, partial [Pristionchus entomophagus]